MSRSVGVILRSWHRILSLPRHYPESWHRERLAEEQVEAVEAPTPLKRLSETSDIFFTITRARINGFDIAPRPAPVRPYNALVYAYMVGKYTGRWSFYRASAALARAPDVRGVNEVVNPHKDGKLDVVARRHGIDPERFVRTGRALRRFWPLLP